MLPGQPSEAPDFARLLDVTEEQAEDLLERVGASNYLTGAAVSNARRRHPGDPVSAWRWAWRYLWPRAYGP